MKEFKPGLHMTAYTTCLQDMDPAPAEPAFDPMAFKPQNPPAEITETPIVSYGMPPKLQQAISNAIVPLAVAVFFWVMFMSGDASAWLACSISLPSLGLALIGAVAPWAVKR